MSSFEDKMKSPKGLEPEHWFTEMYQKHQGHPLLTLVALYKGNYHKFVLHQNVFLSMLDQANL